MNNTAAAATHALITAAWWSLEEGASLRALSSVRECARRWPAGRQDAINERAVRREVIEARRQAERFEALADELGGPGFARSRYLAALDVARQLADADQGPPMR